ncbi:MAG: hypothetical protein H6766_06375 [Candidatus Peribacteria bacterium]|nr:MAG: hypothetical protein H6766_06375 [Candidatus Peribacteria bacterium]
MIIGLLYWFLSGTKLHFDNPLTIQEGDSLTSVLADQGRLDSRRIRQDAEKYGFDPATLAVGTYADIVGSMSIGDFYMHLASGPSATYERVTVLE